MTLRQGLPKLTVRPAPYPSTSQPESRNESLERRSSVVAPSPLQHVSFPRVSPPTGSPEEMNVDLVQESGSDAALRAAGLKVLDLRSAKVDTNLVALVCVTCQHAVYPNNAVVHGQKHGIKLTKQHIADLNTLVPTLRLATCNKDFPHPPNDQGPVEDIKIKSGRKCNACSHVAGTKNSMDTHWSTEHRGEGSPDSTTCDVQTIFAERPRYFVVLPVLTGLGPDDKYRLYLSQFTSEIATADKTIVPPIAESEVPPLLRVTLWHEHLESFTKDKRSVRVVRLLLDSQHANKYTPWLGKPLSLTITSYMQDIKKKMKRIPIPARMLLMQYPV